MNPDYEEHAIIEKLELDKYVGSFIVNNVIALNNKYLVSYTVKKKLSKKNKNTENSISNFNKNVSVPIASAITAHSRIFMSKYKNIPGFNIYYTDTDCLFTDKPLDPKVMGKKLGQWKLEHILKKYVAAAPKVYGGVTESGEEITKVKGLKNKISFNNLEKLLNKNISVEISQEKWYKNIKKGNITIKDQIFTLSATENKRQLIYDENRILIATKPFILNEDEEEAKESPIEYTPACTSEDVEHLE